LTLNDVIDNLPPGATIYAVNGKRALPTATAALAPADSIELVLADGRHYQTLVSRDATDISEPTPLTKATEPKAANPDVRNFGSTASPDWRQYSQTTKTWEPLTGVGAAAKPTIDAKTQALAQSALQKIQAGIKPTQAELQAMNMVRDMAGAGAAGPVAPFTQTGPGGQGNVSQTPVEAAVDATTTDPRVRMAMKLGAYLEGGLGPNFNAGDGGMSWGPFQINHNQGMHSDIGRAESEDPARAAQYMLPEYQAAVSQVPAELWDSDPKAAAARAAYLAERPAAMYDPIRVDAGWNTVFGTGATGGGGLPSLPLGLGTKARAVHTVAPGDTVVDDQGNVLFTAPQKPATPPVNKAMVALQQQYQTIGYVQQQIAAGTMSPTDAASYLGAVKQQTAATLAGTTPYDIYKDDLDQMRQRADLGRQLLDNQLQAGNALTNDLLNQTGKLAGGGYDPIGLARAMTAERSGDVGPQPISDTAKALIDALNPSNPQPTIGSATTAAVGPVLAGAPGLGQPLPVGPVVNGPQQQPQQEAA
jgi:hypothetical protein